MQDPSQQRPGRRAGDSGNIPGQPDNGLKDWQKNTWYGPAPYNSNPFEEPEDAPELLEARSSNVSNHTGEFWNYQQETGYQYSAGELKKNTGRDSVRARKNSEPVISVRVVGFLLLLTVTAVLVLFFGVYRVKFEIFAGFQMIQIPQIGKAALKFVYVFRKPHRRFGEYHYVFA